METVLITGGTGFLGLKLVEMFLLDGYQVIVLARKNTYQSDKFKTVNCNNLIIKFLEDIDLHECFIKHKINCILHTATCYGRNDESWAEIAEVNLLLPLQLLILGKKFGVECFINADTFFNDEIVFDRNESYYIKTKKSFLNIAKDASGSGIGKFFNLRIEQMYGPNDNQKKFIPHIIDELFSGKDIPLTPGAQRRDFVYVDDVARAFLCAYKCRKDLEKFEEFGVGTGISVDIKKVVNFLKMEINSRSLLDFGKLEYRKNEIMDSCAITGNNMKINWRASVEWMDGLEKTINSYEK